jgi:hypothetical protein
VLLRVQGLSTSPGYLQAPCSGYSGSVKGVTIEGHHPNGLVALLVAEAAASAAGAKVGAKCMEGDPQNRVRLVVTKAPGFTKV